MKTIKITESQEILLYCLLTVERRRLLDILEDTCVVTTANSAERILFEINLLRLQIEG